jgi:hypothetical protein
MKATNVPRLNGKQKTRKFTVKEPWSLELHNVNNSGSRIATKITTDILCHTLKYLYVASLAITKARKPKIGHALALQNRPLNTLGGGDVTLSGVSSPTYGCCVCCFNVA